jgi:hypothetical protein
MNVLLYVNCKENFFANKLLMMMKNNNIIQHPEDLWLNGVNVHRQLQEEKMEEFLEKIVVAA